MKIPVRNVYYLLLYAWDRVGEADEVAVAAEGYTRLLDLFAHVLADTATRLLARGLDRGYVAREEAVRGVVGRLELATTLKSNLLPQARTHCAFDELRHDVLHNRIIKATLRTLLDVGVDERIQSRLRRLYRKLDSVADVRVTSRDFGRVQLHRNNRLYDFALRVCRLIHENLMIDRRTGDTSFRDFRANEQQMGAVFEEFVKNFFRREQRRFRVSSPHIRWYDAWGTEADLQRLPNMRSDVVLESPEDCIVLDTKFYGRPLSGWHGSRKVRSDNLYQILSYVTHYSANQRRPVRGMLLYPVVDEAFSFEYRLGGQPISVRSLDLNQPWPRIYADLLHLVGIESPTTQAA